MSAPRKPLSTRHETFCRHVAEGCPPAEAARRAGYPPASAGQRGSELVSRPEIQAHIGELTAERLDELRALRRRTLSRLDVIHDKAIETGRLSLAFRAAIAIARIAGLSGAAVQQRAKPQAAPAWADMEDGTPEPAPGRPLQVPPHLQAALDEVLGTPTLPPARPGAFALDGAAQLPASVLDAMRHPAPATARP